MKLVTVIDVYNKKHRIDLEQYNTNRVQLTRYNQYGKKVSSSVNFDCVKDTGTLHRGNVARIKMDEPASDIKYLEVQPIIYA